MGKIPYNTYYRGTSKKDSQVNTIRTGYIPKYTWITNKRKEAVMYAKMHSEHKKSKPVLITIKLPIVVDINDRAWQLGGGRNAKYWKTNRGLRARTSVKQIKSSVGIRGKSLKPRRRGTVY